MAEILVAEDEALIALMWEDALTEAGHSVTLAHTGLQALGYLKDKKFDLLITDLNMPDGGGFIVTNEAVSLNDKLPIVVVTGDPAFLSTGVLSRMPGLGADELVIKPIPADELVAIANRALERAPSKSLMQRLGDIVEAMRNYQDAPKQK